MVKVLLAAVAIFVACPIGSAGATCVGRGDRFHVEQNPTVTFYFQTDNGRCGNNFSAGGQVMFTSASILAMPEHGQLQQTAPFRFRYRASPGFKGEDRYTLKICGTSRAGSGCATMINVGTVN